MKLRSGGRGGGGGGTDRPVGTTERVDRGWTGVVAGSGGRGVWRLDRSYNIA